MKNTLQNETEHVRYVPQIHSLSEAFAQTTPNKGIRRIYHVTEPIRLSQDDAGGMYHFSYHSGHPDGYWAYLDTFAEVESLLACYGVTSDTGWLTSMEWRRMRCAREK